MNSTECLEKALEYSGIVNNCCCFVDMCIITDHCRFQGEVSECEEYTVFKQIKNALEAYPLVKCSDCKYDLVCHSEVVMDDKYGDETHISLGMDGYCSRAERREDNA